MTLRRGFLRLRGLMDAAFVLSGRLRLPGARRNCRDHLPPARKGRLYGNVG